MLMRSLPLSLAFIIGTLAYTGCAASSQSRQTSSVPAGPVSSGSSARNEVAAGAELQVRTNEAIEGGQPGQTFRAEIAKDVVNTSGEVVIPRGAPAELIVVEADSGGTVGTKTLELGLRSVTVNGRRYDVKGSGDELRSQEGLGRNRRTAEMVGGGAVLGTVLGAVIGGGQGAAVGAAIGAAGGATAQVLTRGKEVRVPAETVLAFRMRETLSIT